MTGLYINYYKTSYIQRFEDLKIDNGINIEDDYIDPNLFNSLLPNDDEIILIYIKKEAEGKNVLSFKRYDYQHPLKEPTTFDKYSQSNYIRDDICEKPKYMQSMFINSPINYDFKDNLLMKVYPNEKYYKYQQDIITIIACDKNNSEVEYQAKKIVMPQCLNILNKINGIEKNNLFTFTHDKTKIVLDIYNDPNSKSLRNVEIHFFDSFLYNNVLIIQAIQDRKRQPPIVRSSTIFNPEKIEFSKTMNFKKGKKYQIPYQIIISSPHYLKSDLCYFEFYYEDPENKEGEEVVEEECSVKNCKECQGNICIECDENIIGIQLDKENNECICDVKNGFNKEPNTTINMCTCKNNYSFYEGIQKCLHDYILNNGPYCVTEKDERSSIYIYGYQPSGMAKYYEDGLPYCRKPPMQMCNTKTWFKLGQYEFKYAKINKCVYILYKNKIVMYSNKSACKYSYYDYKNCMNVNINNENEYNNALKNAYEYIRDDANNSLIINETNITFYILNPYTYKSFSSVQPSPKCIQKVKEINNLPSLLIFVANIKRKDTISTQVEYSFYNPVPEFMNEELNMSCCSKVGNNTEYNSTEYNNTLKRRLQSDIGNISNPNYDIDIDEIIIYEQVDWSEQQSQINNEMIVKLDIDIFDSGGDFYNDICYSFSTPDNISNIPPNVDIYPEGRKTIFYFDEAICAT
jgi:hypothetical protein